MVIWQGSTTTGPPPRLHGLCKFVSVCPYTLQLEPMCPSVSNVRKRDIQQSHFRQLFTEHRQTHQNSVEVYTDGSKSDDAVSLAAVLPGRTIARKLPLAATIYTAELWAMLVAVACFVRSSHSRFTIYSDSVSDIQSVCNSFSTHPLVKQIQLWLTLLKNKH